MIVPPIRTIPLTERRTAVRRVPHVDATELVARYSHALELQPTADRGIYRLTARGYVGWFDTPSIRWVIRPKLPWADLHRMAGLADVRERSVAGLLRGYREQAADSTEVRGRIDFAEQARRHSPGSPFAVVADEFTPDVIWNRIPAATARMLLTRFDLSAGVRADLARSLLAFNDVEGSLPSTESWRQLAFDARTEPYRRLIDWCRLILASVGPGDENSGLLLNLEYLFQAHVGSVLDSPNVRHQMSFAVEPVCGAVAPLILRPDFVVTDPDGHPAAVWDAKWKALTPIGPDPTDVQQVLAYAAALGVRTVGLVYPGRSFAVREYCTPSGVGLVAVRLRLTSSDELRRLILGRSCGEPQA